jgi:type III pantothenate kinase
VCIVTGSSILTIDIGNSRIKWALWKNALLVEQGAHDYRADNLPAILSRAWSALEVPAQAILACVAGAAAESEVQNWLTGHWQVEARVLRTTKQFAGLRHAYAQPEQHGVDRWAAMIAARKLYQTPLCVISCGTATTLDLIDADGQHLGGQIMPGTELMFAALKARIPVLSDLEFSSAVPDRPFATNTDDAVHLGVTQMAAAGLDHACDAARELLGANMKILITGGAAAAMLALMKNSVELQTDLVLYGLYLALQQELA